MDRRGFTLLELLVVLALIGVFLAIGAPYISSSLPSWQTRSAAREVAAALRKARSQAIFTDTDSVFSIDVNRRLYSLSGDPTTHPLPAKLHITLYTAQQALFSRSIGSIRFFPDGSSTGGRVTLSDGKQQ